MTVEDVNSSIKKYLQFENLQIAFITNEAEQLKVALVKNAESPIEYATPKSEEVYEQDKFIKVFPLEIQEGKVKIVDVEQLFK